MVRNKSAIRDAWFALPVLLTGAFLPILDFNVVARFVLRHAVAWYARVDAGLCAPGPRFGVVMLGVGTGR